MFGRKKPSPKPLILKDSDLVAMPYPCPHPECRGKLVVLKGDIGMMTPAGRVKREDKRQFYCLKCHSHYVGQSAKSISKMTFTPSERGDWLNRLAKQGIVLK